jgi:cation transport regulator ChaB
MAYPDLSDLRQRVKDLLNASRTGFYSDTIINRWLNDGQWDVAVKALCYEREHAIVTTANSRSTVVNAVKVLGVELVDSDGSRKGLGKITPRMVGHLPLTGDGPQFWFPWGNKVCVEPIPAQVYNLIAYVAIHPLQVMSADTDEPEIPPAFIPLTIWYAHIRGLMRDRKFATAGRYYQIYMDSVIRAAENTIKKHADRRGDFSQPTAIEAIKNE